VPKVMFVACDGSEREVTAADGTTLMRAAVENDVPGIVATCGGSLACASCHVYVDEAWLDLAGDPSEEEEIMLEFAVDPRPNSRLSCQIVLDATLDGLVVHVPDMQAQ
jgi:ferredoxin, 2Fe-2S